MTALNLLYLSLVFHISGLALWAGSTVAEYILLKQFWKIHAVDKEQGLGAYRLLSSLPRLFAIGFGLLLLSGITMFLVMGGVFGSQRWFQVKMILLLVAIINGIVIGRRLGVSLRGLLQSEAAGKTDAAAFGSIKRKFNLFHMVQLSVFLLIFICSIFKFN
jgi:hypothetical protein